MDVSEQSGEQDEGQSTELLVNRTKFSSEKIEEQMSSLIELKKFQKRHKTYAK